MTDPSRPSGHDPGGDQRRREGHPAPNLVPAHWQVPSFETKELGPKRTKFCVGIPVINENGRIQTQLKRMQGAGLPQLADIVIGDGGSTDGSVDPGFLAATGVRSLLVKTGPGKLSAQLRILFAYALIQGYAGIILIDGNNKDGVEAIKDFLAALEEGWDYVQGSRYIPGGVEKNTPLLRKVAVKLVHAPILSATSGYHYTDTTNGFRALSARFLSDDRVQPFRDVFDAYQLHFYLSRAAPRLGFRVKETPVSRTYPEAGPTPSKIGGWIGYASILVALLKTVLGRFDPDRSGR